MLWFSLGKYCLVPPLESSKLFTLTESLLWWSSNHLYFTSLAPHISSNSFFILEKLEFKFTMINQTFPFSLSNLTNPIEQFLLPGYRTRPESPTVSQYWVYMVSHILFDDKLTIDLIRHFSKITDNCKKNLRCLANIKHSKCLRPDLKSTFLKFDIYWFFEPEII